MNNLDRLDQLEALHTADVSRFYRVSLALAGLEARTADPAALPRHELVSHVRRLRAALADGRPVQPSTETPEFERTPRGTINNCALANGEAEADCQVCNSRCPDKVTP